MDRERRGFVNVDELMSQVSLEKVLTYYGRELPEIRRIGEEIRMRCVLNCGRTGETGDRAISIQPEHPAKLWRCHEKDCGRGGNLVSLCDFLKPGETGNGKPRGDRFKAILKDLQAMASGEALPQETQSSEAKPAPTRKAEPRKNRPLAESSNERARGLVNLDEKFLVDPADMSPKAASYFRHRRYLTPEACKAWRVGYLPRDGGGDHAGGTMRGKIVFPVLSEDGEVLTWFGRDPEFEEKEHEWIAGGKQGKEPEKYHFVKGFERGLELFGQHRIGEESVREKIAETGLILVPGPNDVIALDALGVASLGLCATAVTREQAEKAARLAYACGAPGVTLMLDRTEEGELAAREALPVLASFTLVRLAWSKDMHGGAFKGRSASSLTREEWDRLRASMVACGGDRTE